MSYYNSIGDHMLQGRSFSPSLPSPPSLPLSTRFAARQLLQQLMKPKMLISCQPFVIVQPTLELLPLVNKAAKWQLQGPAPIQLVSQSLCADMTNRKF